MVGVSKAARKSAPVLCYPHWPLQVSKMIFFRLQFQPLIYVLSIMDIMSICRPFRLWEHLWCCLSVFSTPDKKIAIPSIFPYRSWVPDHKYKDHFVLSPQKSLIHTYFSWYSILRIEHKVLLEILSAVRVVEVICCIADISVAISLHYALIQPVLCHLNPTPFSQLLVSQAIFSPICFYLIGYTYVL